MRRRNFVAMSGGVAVTWPLAAAGQQREKPRVIAVVLGDGSVADFSPPKPIYAGTRAFLHRLRDLGWIEGRNLIIERRSAENRPERAPAIFAELVSAGVEVIWLSGEEWLIRAALRTTSTVPLVAYFFGREDPAALGLVATLARPGGNLTGVVRRTGIPRKRFEYLLELAPRTTRIGYLGTNLQVQHLPPDVVPAGTRLVPAVAETLDEFDQAFALILRERCDAMLVTGVFVHFINRSRIIAFAAQQGLPASYGAREAVHDGGLMSFGSDNVDDNKQFAELIDSILRGARPADLPIRQADRFELVINRRTADSLGLTIPPSLEVAAEVVE